MNSDSKLPSDSPLAIEAAILDAFLDELAAGNEPDLARLQARFPQHREAVAHEFERLRREHDADQPARIAHYSIAHELGRGGQGRVYLATDERLGRQVALKVLPDHGLLSTRALARFRREAEITARLDHPGICTVLDAGQADGAVYIAMRYLDGASLAQRNARRRARGSAPTREDILIEVRLFERIARAVHAAHEAGVVHRDLKPGNIMLTRDGDPIVLDFGLAARDDGSSKSVLTRSGEVFGTPAYMAPEQLRGESAVTARADVYSLGASLFECVTLSQPLEASSREALFNAILESPPRDPKLLNPAVPRDLCTVLNITLEKAPGQRYRSAEDFAEDLRRIVAYEPIVARPPGLSKRAWRWIQRNRIVASAAAVLLLGLSAALVTSLHFLEESETSRQQLSAAIDDIRTGQETKRKQWLEERLTTGYQALYSADPRPARGIFEELLAAVPRDLDALAGRVWLEIEDPDHALEVLNTHALPAHDPRELAWLRGFVLAAGGDDSGAAKQFAIAGDVASSLRLYFEALHRVDSFMRPVSEDDMATAFGGFRSAALRSTSPRFHHFHSMLMTASYLDDVDKLTTSAAHLEFHWPEAAATHDAIAQFLMSVDRERAVRALHRLVEMDTGAAPYCGLAHVALLDGELDVARAHLDTAITRDPTFAAARFMRGDLMLKQGDATLARADFLACLEYQPTLTQAADGLESAHARLADTKLANEDAARLVELDAKRFAELAARIRRP